MASWCFWFSWSHHAFLKHAPSPHAGSLASLSWQQFEEIPGLSTFSSWSKEYRARQLLRARSPRQCSRTESSRCDWAFFLACTQMSLSSSSQELSGFSLNYWPTMSSHIISISQTCCGLVFLRRKAPKTCKVPEGTGKEYSFFAYVNSLEWAWRWGVGRQRWYWTPTLPFSEWNLFFRKLLFWNPLGNGTV